MNDDATWLWTACFLVPAAVFGLALFGFVAYVALRDRNKPRR
jgi:hypothetical protein